MIWNSPGRQHTWLAVGARTFALLSLVLPLILKNNQLLLLALLAMGAIWAAVTAGELLDPAAHAPARARRGAGGLGGGAVVALDDRDPRRDRRPSVHGRA